MFCCYRYDCNQSQCFNATIDGIWYPNITALGCPLGYRCWDDNTTATCRSACSFSCDNGGQCIGDDTCECTNGWDGYNCNIPICTGGCGNGTCTSPANCTCDDGYSGIDCRTGNARQNTLIVLCCRV
jgi:hypothetical protein